MDTQTQFIIASILMQLLFLILFLRQVHISRRLTKENEIDRAESLVDINNWKSTASALKADVEKWQEEVESSNLFIEADKEWNTKLQAMVRNSLAVIKKQTEALAESERLLTDKYDIDTEPLKVGDWVRGKAYGFNYEEEGDINEFVCGSPIVNGIDFDPSTTRRVPRPVEDKIDWTKPVAFPEGYIVPEGVDVIVVSESRHPSNEYYRKPGLKGITTEKSIVPFCKWEDGKTGLSMMSHELAPLNPKDHPNHPEFGK